MVCLMESATLWIEECSDDLPAKSSPALKEKNWKYILRYADDVIFTEHLQHLECIFQKIKEAGLTLKPIKCRFAAKKVTYLGHLFSKNRIKVDKTKIDTVVNIPSVHDVRHFLGICSYYRKFSHTQTYVGHSY